MGKTCSRDCLLEKFSPALLLDFKLQLVILFFVLIIEHGNGFIEPSGRRPVFDQLWDFFPKYRYGKAAATVRTMCVPIRT
jgi:hypothetical protein